MHVGSLCLGICTRGSDHVRAKLLACCGLGGWRETVGHYVEQSRLETTLYCHTPEHTCRITRQGHLCAWCT